MCGRCMNLFYDNNALSTDWHNLHPFPTFFPQGVAINNNHIIILLALVQGAP